MFLWTQLANGEGGCTNPTHSTKTGTVWGLCWHNLPREGKGRECREVKTGNSGR